MTGLHEPETSSATAVCELVRALLLPTPNRSAISAGLPELAPALATFMFLLLLRRLFASSGPGTLLPWRRWLEHTNFVNTWVRKSSLIHRWSDRTLPDVGTVRRHACPQRGIGQAWTAYFYFNCSSVGCSSLSGCLLSAGTFGGWWKRWMMMPRRIAVM